MNGFGERLKCLLKERRMKQKELAERVGLSEAAITRYINGQRQPKAGPVAKIAVALQTTADYLLGIGEDKR